MKKQQTYSKKKKKSNVGENPPAYRRMWRTWWWWTLPPTFWGRILTRDVTPTVASFFPLLQRHISSNEARWCPCASHTRIGRRTRTPSPHLGLFVVVVVKKEEGNSSLNAPQWSWEDEQHSHSSEKQADRGAPRSREGSFWQAAGKCDCGVEAGPVWCFTA